MRKRWLSTCAVSGFATGCLFAQTPPRVQTFPLNNTSGLIAPAVKTETAKYLGRNCVRVTMEGEDHAGLALLPATDFQDGVIEADIALKITTPPGVPRQGTRPSKTTDRLRTRARPARPPPIAIIPSRQ